MDRRFKQLLVVSAAALHVLTGGSLLGATLNGKDLALRSNGSQPSGTNSWRLTENGYVGTYITLPSAGSVTISVQALGGSTGPTPRMNLAVNDSLTGWNVTPTSTTYGTTLSLPAGTHFIRTEYANDTSAATGSLQIASLQVTGAAFANSSTNANALAAANTYINNYRKGAATIALNGPGGIPLLAGTQVQADLKRHAFNFGAAVGGISLNDVNGYLNNANYSNFLRTHFNSISMGNAGKWAYNEATRDVITMSAVDRLFQYAQDNSMRVRTHNMLWGDSQQPSWVNTLLNNANSGNITAKNDLRAEISERIDHYVGDGDANPNDGDRAARYVEMDLLNEHVHQPKYWNVYGASGIADIFNEARQAVTAANSSARLYLNEYNVLQWSADEFSNWYRQDIEELNNAGFGNVVGGVGVQYYVTKSAAAQQYNPHSPARIHQILQNLSVTGLPISLTEFGVANDGATLDDAANYLEDTMRLLFGSPNASSFIMWGFWANDIWNQAPLAALVDANWNLTPVGARYESLMSQWDTNGTFTVGADGKISFTGFFGDYGIGSASLTLVKGTGNYALSFTEAAPPPAWSFWNENNSGSWTSGTNWTAGGVPNAIGQTAYFDNAAAARTVNVDGGKTVGMLAFNSAGTYTLSGGTITLDGHAGNAAIYVAAGNHSIASAIALNDDLDVTVAPAASTLKITGPVNATGRSITKIGQGAAQFEVIRAAALNVTGGTLRIAPKPIANDPAFTSIVGALSVAAGTFDLANNSLVIDYTGAAGALENDIRQMLLDGRITSSNAGGGKRLGYADNAAIDADSLLIKFTFDGDTNLDGQVDITDLGNLATSWQSSGTWGQGDSDYSGFVDITDLGMLATNWQAGVGSPLGPSFTDALAAVGFGGITVPEPGAAAALLLTGVAALRRRRAR